MSICGLFIYKYVKATNNPVLTISLLQVFGIEKAYSYQKLKIKWTYSMEY